MLLFLLNREIVRKYCIKVKELGFRIQEYTSESLDLEKDYIKNALEAQGRHMTEILSTVPRTRTYIWIAKTH